MKLVYEIVGIIAVFAVSLATIELSIKGIFDSLQNRRENRCENWVKAILTDMDRWCDYEFPQVGFAAGELHKGLSGGWSFNQESFRGRLRDMVKK